MGQTVRIDPKTHAKLSALARAKHLPLTEVLARAVDTYDRAELLAQFNADYAALRQDPEAWQEELRERAAWNSTNLDGLEDEQETQSTSGGVSTRQAGPRKRTSNRKPSRKSPAKRSRSK